MLCEALKCCADCVISVRLMKCMFYAHANFLMYSHSLSLSLGDFLGDNEFRSEE